MAYVDLATYLSYIEPVRLFYTSGKPYKHDSVFHYCSVDSFLKIIDPYLKRDKPLERREGSLLYCSFIATHIRYLNDEQEYKEGIESLNSRISKKTKKGVKAPNDEIYVACFCDEPDNLTQWKYYGSDSGIAIEFSTKNVYLNYCDKADFSSDFDIRFKPFDVFYEDHMDAIKYINSLDKRMCSEHAQNQALIPYMKNHNFIGERESRIVLYNLRKSKRGKPASSVQYRISQGMIKPYLGMRLFYKGPEGEKKIPIKSVTVGPGINADKICNSLCQLLEPEKTKSIKYIDDINAICKPKKGSVSDERKIVYTTTNGIEIYKSSVPFRNY